MKNKFMFSNLLIKFYIIINFFYFKRKNVITGDKLRVRGITKLKISKSGKLSIGDNFNMTGGFMLNPLGRNLKSFIRVDDNARIFIGNNVGMSCVSIWSKKSITIGNNVKFGAGVIVLDSDMHALDHELRRDPLKDDKNAISEPILIGDDVFIGVNCIITKGVVIGNRAIVAAGSVVVKSIPADEIWGGNPAKLLRKNS